MKGIESASSELWKDPSEKNWTVFSRLIKKSRARYYRIVYQNEGKLNKVQDLKKSFAELYDSRYRPVAKVPIFMNNGKGITGATIYLVGLSVINGLVE